MIAAKVDEEAAARRVVAAHVAPQIGLEQYYREAGPDYAAWSREFNMHFGYYRAGTNPLHREAMLEQMNAEVLARLQLDGIAEPQLLDLGCALAPHCAALRAVYRVRGCWELRGCRGRRSRHMP
jgi:MPBQ/MSBQ methyltransferase